MSPEERELLNGFLDQLVASAVPSVNAEANSLIRQAVAKQPNADYLLVQRCLLLEQALSVAKNQLEDLRTQANSRQSEQPAGFLSGNPWVQQFGEVRQSAGVPAANSYQAPRVANATPAAAAPPFQGTGFLSNMATTAAGVVAGSFVFQGIEGLLGHHRMNPLSEFGQTSHLSPESTTINNYYAAADAGEGPDDGRDGYVDGADDGADPGDDSSWA